MFFLRRNLITIFTKRFQFLQYKNKMNFKYPLCIFRFFLSKYLERSTIWPKQVLSCCKCCKKMNIFVTNLLHISYNYLTGIKFMKKHFTIHHGHRMWHYQYFFSKKNNNCRPTSNEMIDFIFLHFSQYIPFLV